MGMSEKIRMLLVKKGNIPEAELARRLKKTPQSLNAKLKRDNFTEKDLKEIADVMGCEYKANFVDKETGEIVI